MTKWCLKQINLFFQVVTEDDELQQIQTKENINHKYYKINIYSKQMKSVITPIGLLKQP